MFLPNVLVFFYCVSHHMQEKTFNCRAQGCKSVIWVQESTFIVFLNCFGRFLTTFFEGLSAEATASKIAPTCRKTLLVAVFFSVTQFSNDSWGFQKSIQNIVRVSLCVCIWFGNVHYLHLEQLSIVYVFLNTDVVGYLWPVAGYLSEYLESWELKKKRSKKWAKRRKKRCH